VFIWNLYATAAGAAWILYGAGDICTLHRSNDSSANGRLQSAAGEQGAFAMLDIIYLLIGAAFLGGCVLYAIACDHL
jgi:hypothetical protein